MLRAVAAGPQVVVCATCRVSAGMREDDLGRRGGALLAEALRAEQAADPAFAGIAIEQMDCLFACERHCTIHIRAPGRIGYVLGDFAPTAEAARAILAYAALHAHSAEGQVRYAEWPDGVKGHFITRTPPEGFILT
jgi:predicted metal-binding protein